MDVLKADMVKLVEDWLALVTSIEQCDSELEEARLPSS